MADLDPSQSDRVTLDDDGGGTSEHQHQSAHGQPNAVVRSVARALAKCSSCVGPGLVDAEVNAVGGSRVMLTVYRAEKFSAEVNGNTCLNFIRGVF